MNRVYYQYETRNERIEQYASDYTARLRKPNRAIIVALAIVVLLGLL